MNWIPTHKFLRSPALMGGLSLLLFPAWLAAQRLQPGYFTLSENFYRSGKLTVAAFAPVVTATRPSVIQVFLDGQAVALGVVVDASGLAITKASELKQGTLTAKLHDGRSVELTQLATDPGNDVALVKLKAAGLKPVVWSDTTLVLGQWLVTPGVRAEPEAVGVLSASNRKLHKRAIIGVTLDPDASNARISGVQPGFGAARAGLRAGDVILTVNGTVVKDNEELRNSLSDFREGLIVELRVDRDGDEFNVSVEMKPEASLLPPPSGRGLGRSGRTGRFAGEVSQRAEDFEIAMQHDTVLQPEQCGGPLLNLDGKVVALNIARAGRIASYALPASLVKRIIAELKSRSGELLNDAPKSGS